MIAALMLYSIAVSLLLAAATAAAERLLRLVRQPRRFIWLAAMIVSIVISGARFYETRSAAIGPIADVATQEILDTVATQPASLRTTSSTKSKSSRSASIRRALASGMDAARIRVGAASTLENWNRPLVIGWAAGSLLAFLVIAISALRLARPRPRWSGAVVNGVPVLVSHDLGPAVIGVLRYRIVLPAWVLDLSDVERDLVLVHEREHANVGDPSLLFAATMLVALCPWNIALWWMARRLRFAMELDCDARVLRVRPDRAAYGALLLAVNERTYSGAMPIVALAEPVSLTERRIAAIASRMPRFALVRAAGAGFVALALATVSCIAPHPTLTFQRPATATRVTSVEQSRAPSELPETPKPLLIAKSTRDTSRLVLRETPVPNASLSHDSAQRASAARPDSALTPQTQTPAPIRPPQSDSLPTGGGRGLGRGNAADIPRLVDSIFHRLFDDISIGADQEQQVRDFLTRLATTQVAQSNATIEALTAALPRRTALQAQRDSSLRTLLASDADRATFDSRLVLPGTGRRGGPPPANPNGGRSGGPGGRSGGGGGGGGGGGLDNLVDAMFRRLFDGLSITPDQEASARAIIRRTQLDLQALVPPPGPLHLAMSPNGGRVMMQEPSATALAALAPSDSDREKLRSRIVVLAPPPQRP